MQRQELQNHIQVRSFKIQFAVSLQNVSTLQTRMQGWAEEHLEEQFLFDPEEDFDEAINLFAIIAAHQHQQSADLSVLCNQIKYFIMDLQDDDRMHSLARAQNFFSTKQFLNTLNKVIQSKKQLPANVLNQAFWIIGQWMELDIQKINSADLRQELELLQELLINIATYASETAGLASTALYAMGSMVILLKHFNPHPLQDYLRNQIYPLVERLLNQLSTELSLSSGQSSFLKNHLLPYGISGAALIDWDDDKKINWGANKDQLLQIAECNLTHSVTTTSLVRLAHGIKYSAIFWNPLYVLPQFAVSLKKSMQNSMWGIYFLGLDVDCYDHQHSDLLILGTLQRSMLADFRLSLIQKQGIRVFTSLEEWSNKRTRVKPISPIEYFVTTFGSFAENGTVPSEDVNDFVGLKLETLSVSAPVSVKVNLTSSRFFDKRPPPRRKKYPPLYRSPELTEKPNAPVSAPELAKQDSPVSVTGLIAQQDLPVKVAQLYPHPKTMSLMYGIASLGQADERTFTVELLKPFFHEAHPRTPAAMLKDSFYQLYRYSESEEANLSKDLINDNYKILITMLRTYIDRGGDKLSLRESYQIISALYRLVHLPYFKSSLDKKLICYLVDCHADSLRPDEILDYSHGILFRLGWLLKHGYLSLDDSFSGPITRLKDKIAEVIQGELGDEYSKTNKNYINITWGLAMCKVAGLDGLEIDDLWKNKILTLGTDLANAYSLLPVAIHSKAADDEFATRTGALHVLQALSIFGVPSTKMQLLIQTCLPPNRGSMDRFKRNVEKLYQSSFVEEQFIHGYYVDFYSAENNLIIELDGESHDLIEKAQSDRFRDAWLKRKGCVVLRYNLNKSNWPVFEKLKSSVLENQFSCITDWTSRGINLDKVPTRTICFDSSKLSIINKQFLEKHGYGVISDILADCINDTQSFVVFNKVIVPFINSNKLFDNFSLYNTACLLRGIADFWLFDDNIFQKSLPDGLIVKLVTHMSSTLDKSRDEALRNPKAISMALQGLARLSAAGKIIYKQGFHPLTGAVDLFLTRARSYFLDAQYSANSQLCTALWAAGIISAASSIKIGGIESWAKKAIAHAITSPSSSVRIATAMGCGLLSCPIEDNDCDELSMDVSSILSDKAHELLKAGLPEEIKLGAFVSGFFVDAIAGKTIMTCEDPAPADKKVKIDAALRSFVCDILSKKGYQIGGELNGSHDTTPTLRR